MIKRSDYFQYLVPFVQNNLDITVSHSHRSDRHRNRSRSILYHHHLQRQFRDSNNSKRKTSTHLSIKDLRFTPCETKLSINFKEFFVSLARSKVIKPCGSFDFGTMPVTITCSKILIASRKLPLASIAINSRSSGLILYFSPLATNFNLATISSILGLEKIICVHREITVSGSF